MILNIPNSISLIRILVSPFVYIFITSKDSSYVQAGCILYLFAAATDYIDGWLARKYKDETNLGIFIDPLADKFLTTSAFLSFVALDIVPLWMVIIILIRDFGTTFLRIFADKCGIEMKTSMTAKWKTFLQMFFIAFLIIILFLINFQHEALSYDFLKSILYSNIISFIMLILTLFSVWTIIEYFTKNKLLTEELRKSFFQNKRT